MMADNGNDFVVIPKEVEDMRINQTQIPLDLSVPDVKKKEVLREVVEESTKPKETIAKKTIVKPKSSRSGNERIARVIKLALLLAKNGSYNEELQIKDIDGNFVPGSDLPKFIRFATQNLRRFEGIDNYLHQLSKINVDISNLISNPVVIRLLELENENSSQPIQIQDTEKEIEGPPAEEKAVKRKKSFEENSPLSSQEFWTTEPPKKLRVDNPYGEGLSSSNVDEIDWEKISFINPELDDSLAFIEKDLFNNVDK